MTRPANYDELASDLVQAFGARDQAALDRVNAHYERAFTLEDLDQEIWRRVYAFRQRASRVTPNYVALDEARTLLAQDAGFGSWDALLAAAASGAAATPGHEVDPAAGRIAPRRYLRGREWDELLAVARERRLTAIDGGGLLTDDLLERIAALDEVTSLSLGGSRLVTDRGLRHLARMPRLERLDLQGTGRVTDEGLEVLRALPNLRVFEMAWHRGVTDRGVSHLEACDRLEQVNLMGTATGDGAIAALGGKSALRTLSTGRLVTDEGLARLRAIPAMTQAPPAADPVDADGLPVSGGRLLIDGPFTDGGLASLAGLDGVVQLDLFWNVTAVTPEGFRHLAGLANLMGLGADGALTDDVSMGHIAALPRLRRLRAQGSAATDAGFEALGRSRSLEWLWGREAPHLTGRGFRALAGMSRLRSLGISLARVDDAALAWLPSFPALTELTPIDVGDDGFRHVGRCERLERLVCMYCRTTTDAATAHVARLGLRYYYAGLTGITDRSLELLGGMPTLEQADFYECRGITDAGLAFLARLPRLREVNLDHLPGVTLDGTRVFPARVRVRYTA